MGLWDLAISGLYAVVKEMGDSLSDILYPTPETPMQRYRRAENEKKKKLSNEDRMKQFKSYKADMEKSRGRTRSKSKQRAR